MLPHQAPLATALLPGSRAIAIHRPPTRGPVIATNVKLRSLFAFNIVGSNKPRAARTTGIVLRKLITATAQKARITRQHFGLVHI